MLDLMNDVVNAALVATGVVFLIMTVGEAVAQHDNQEQ